MNTSRFITLVASCISLACGISFAQDHRFTPLPMDPSLHYGVMENGLTYYVKENKTEPERADFYIVQNVGAILEEDSQNGLAHFLEHMAFNGTEHFPGKGIINYLEGYGVEFGRNINAYTSLDETVYNLKAVPTTQWGTVDSCLLILRDWSHSITLATDEIEKERGVILEEWRTRNNANRRMWTESCKQLFAGSQYAKRNVIGDTAVVLHHHPDTLRAYYKRWYRPDQQAIIVVGDIDADSVEARIRSLFSDIKRDSAWHERPLYKLKRLEAPMVARITDKEATISRIELTFRQAPMPDIIHASIVGYHEAICQSLIKMMLDARLDEEVSKPDCPFVGCWSSYGELVRSCDAFSAECVPAQGESHRAMSRMVEILQTARIHGWTQSELDRAKAEMRSVIRKAYAEQDKTKNNSYVGEYQRNFLDFEPIPGIAWEESHIDEILASISLADLDKLYQSWLDSDQRTILISAPSSEDTNGKLITKQEALDILNAMDSLKVEPYVDKVSDAPLVGKIKSHEGKRIAVDTTLGFIKYRYPNGATVILKKSSLKNDEIKINAFCPGGLSLTSDTSMLPSVMMCDEIIETMGIGDFTAIDLQKVLAGKQVSLSPSVSRYEQTLSGTSTVDDLETMMQLLYLYQTTVHIDNEAYQSMCQQYETALLHRSEKPQTSFTDSITAITSCHSPYVFPLTLEKFRAIELGKAVEAYKKLFHHPNGFTYVITGNIEYGKVLPLIDKYIGGQTKDKKAKVKMVDLGIRLPKASTTCDFSRQMNTPQTSVYAIYHHEMDYTLKNKVILSIISSILDYRYLDSCREREGGTYGVSVRTLLSTTPINEARLTVNFNTDPAKEQLLSSIITAEIDTIIANGVRADDLAKAKELLIKVRKESLKENNFWTAQIIHQEKYGYQTLTGFDEIVNSISSADIVEVLRQLRDAGSDIWVKQRPGN